MEIIGEPAATKDEQIERKSAGRRKERVGSFWGGVDYLGKPRGAPWPLWRGARFFSIRHNPYLPDTVRHFKTEPENAAGRCPDGDTTGLNGGYGFRCVRNHDRLGEPTPFPYLQSL